VRNAEWNGVSPSTLTLSPRLLRAIFGAPRPIALPEVELPETGSPTSGHRGDNHYETNQVTPHRGHLDGCRYALHRDSDCWQLSFEGRQARFKHELGALYVAYLLLNSPRQPLHAVALALKARQWASQATEPDEAARERSMGLEEAVKVRALWRRQRELERMLADRDEIEPVKAEALRELEDITERLRTSPWLSRHGAERCIQAVTLAIKRFQARLSGALDAEGKPDEVLQAFALHLHEHLLVPSGRGGAYSRAQAPELAGCLIYEPPRPVKWAAHGPQSTGQSPQLPTQEAGLKTQDRERRRPAAFAYLSRFLCAGFALALLVTGCAGPRPLKGGKATTTRSPAGLIQQSVAQGENASQPSKQDQESIKVRTYTLPAATRVEQGQISEGERPREPKLPRSTGEIRAREDARPPGSQEPSTLNSQPSTTYILSAPMPVIEREETRARTELGTAQKDTARDLAAKLSSLKGIVWVGVGLFIFGLASLVYPPLKAIVASVTTSVALMLGGVALIVLPTMVVGNELLILGVVGLVVGAWFLAHRHGQLSGLVAASTEAKPGSSNQGPGTSNQ
jgi:hypothetical protein